MGKVQGVVTIILAFVMLSSLVGAVTSIKIKTIDDHIQFSEKALFNVTLTNLGETVQHYEIFSRSSGIDWSLHTNPLRNKLLTLQPKESRTVEVVVEPVEKFSPSVHLVSLNIESQEGEKYEQPLTIYMGPSTPQDYLPSIRPYISMNDHIDPREAQSVQVFVENLNPRDLTGMIVKVISDIPQFNTEQVIDLKPSEQRTFDFTFQLAQTQQPKDYIIFFQFEHDGEIVKIIDKRVEVIALILNFTQSVQEEKSFLKTKKIMTFTNPGNVRNMQTMKVPAGLFQSIVTKAKPQAGIMNENSRRLLAWDVELGPTEQAAVTMTVSYRTPIALLLLIFIALLFYVIYRNPLILTKSASNVTMHEGGVSGIKIVLIVKNLGNTVMKDIEVTDKVPSIASIEKDVDMGSIKPLQIMRGEHGHIFIKWKLSELEGKEERHIVYKIKSKLNVIGTMELPRAKATFIVSPGKKKTSYSNVYRISTGE